MGKLSQFKNEEALEVLADMIEPLAEVVKDSAFIMDVRENFKKGSERPRLIAYALKNHAHSVISILAAMDRVPVEEYECNVMTLPAKILDILNDEDLLSYFLSQAETEISSGSATPSTEEEETVS